MKKFLVLLVVVALVPVLTGCMWTSNMQTGAAVMQSSDPGMVGDQDVSPSKKGVAEAKGIILFYFGDNSISAAMEDQNITRIHHVDYETLNVLGLYIRRKTIVYGE